MKRASWFLCAALLAAFSFEASASPLLGFGRLHNGRLGNGALGAGSLGGNIGGPFVATPIFDTGDPNSTEQVWGPSTLSSTLTINGTTGTLVMRYIGDDVTATGWDPEFGEVLDISAAGGANTLAEGPFADDTQRVQIVDRYYVADNAAFGEITTEDIVIEFIAAGGAGLGADSLLGKYNGTAGWEVRTGSGSGGVYVFALDVGATVVSMNSATSLTSTGWRHGLIFIDRDEASTDGGHFFLDAAPASGVNFSTAAATVANSGTFRIGANDSGALFDGGIAYVAVWKASGWFAGGVTNTTQWTTVAAQRFAAISGTTLVAPADQAPSVATRSSTAFLRKCDPATDEINYHLVGPAWMRREVSCGKDWTDPTAAGEYSSFLVEPARTNIALHGVNLDNATGGWSVGRTTTVLDAGAGPRGPATMDRICNDTQTGAHYINKSMTQNASCASFVTRYDGAQHVGIQSSTAGTPWIVYDIVNGAITDRSNAATDGIENLGDGNWRVWACDNGTTQYGNLMYLTICADHATTAACVSYTGAVDECIYADLYQKEAGRFITSPIVTTTASVTRSADVLAYTVTVPTGSGSAVLDFTPPPGLAGNSQPLTMRDGDGSESVGVNFNSPTLAFSGQASSVSQWSLTGTPTLNNGAHRVFRGVWDTNDARAWLDGAAFGTPDTTVTVPGDLTTVYVSSRETGTLQTGASTFRLRIYDDVYAPGEAGTGSDEP